MTASKRDEFDDFCEESIDMWKLRGEREEARKMFLANLWREMQPEFGGDPRFFHALAHKLLLEIGGFNLGVSALSCKVEISGLSGVIAEQFMHHLKQEILKFAPTSEIERNFLLTSLFYHQVITEVVGSYHGPMVAEDDEHPERSILLRSPAS